MQTDFTTFLAMTKPLDISSLANAINALAEGIDAYRESKENPNANIKALNTLQSGVIHWKINHDSSF